MINGTTQGTTNVAFKASYGKNWGNYFYIATPLHEYNQFYTYNFEMGNWEDMGRFVQANINYAFNKTTHGVLKIYDFRGSGDQSSTTGIVGALRVHYQSPHAR